MYLLYTDIYFFHLSGKTQEPKTLGWSLFCLLLLLSAGLIYQSLRLAALQWVMDIRKTNDRKKPQQKKQTPTAFMHLSHFFGLVFVRLCVFACMQDMWQGLEDDDAYQHMWAQCRSTGPGHWAQPRTWWHWSRAACSLDCIQTVLPYRCQSHSLSASQSGAQGLSYTEWRLSEGQLRIKGEEASIRGRKTKSVGWVC